MTWTAVRDVAGPKAIGILPAGAIEAHGPHLPIGTDVIIAEAMARSGAERLSARGFDALVLPPLPFAPAPFAAAFPGTIHTPPDATTSMVAAIARSLAAHGIRVLVIANSHHDPAQVNALQAAVASAAKHAGTTIVFPDLTRRRWAEKLTAEFRTGCHAGRYEGSIVLAADPETVRSDVMGTLPPNVRSLVDAIRAGHHTFAEAGGPLAYFGTPAEATAEEGREIIDILGAIIEEAVVELVQAGSIASPA